MESVLIVLGSKAMNLLTFVDNGKIYPKKIFFLNNVDRVRLNSFVNSAFYSFSHFQIY